VAKDKYHNAVRSALEKAGWTITHDPYILRVDKTKLEIDLGASLMLGAERDEQHIAVEIKVFQIPSLVTAFHLALGQYLNYRLGLDMVEPERVLYLAVPQGIFKNFLSARFAQRAIVQFGVHVVVFDPKTEVIVSWH
jgi:hypothetical protein